MPRRGGLWNYRNFIVDLERLQQRIAAAARSAATAAAGAAAARRAGRRGVALRFAVHRLFGDGTVRRVHVVLELFVHAERGRAHGAFVRKVGGFQRHIVVAGDVVEELPLVHLHATTVKQTRQLYIRHPERMRRAYGS